jgi:TolA-binding protein
MSDRLDRIEAGLDETRKIVESNARAILALANQGVELNAKIDRTNAIVTELANIVYAVSNRQEDQEHHITRLKDRL